MTSENPSKKLRLPPPGVTGLFSDSAYDPAVEAAIMASAKVYVCIRVSVLHPGL